MHNKVVKGAMLLSVLALVGQASAQTAPQSSQAGSKKTECRTAGRQQNLKGMDLADSIELCVEEARLDCLKAAIAQKVDRAGRSNFIRACIGS